MPVQALSYFTSLGLETLFVTLHFRRLLAQYSWLVELGA